jgi:hypothetical protein
VQVGGGSASSFKKHFYLSFTMGMISVILPEIFFLQLNTICRRGTKFLPRLQQYNWALEAVVVIDI